YLIIFILILIYIIMGMFIEGIAILVLTLPVTYPIVVLELGFDGIWFGVIMVMLINIGALTPPLGILAFIINAVDNEIPLQVIFKGLIPLLIVMVGFTVLCVIFPEII